LEFLADLHVHSRHSRATAHDCDLGRLAHWAGRKGLSVIGTGDFTHPAWQEEIERDLVDAEPGLLRHRDERAGPARFMLTVEISTIYGLGGRTRKVHHVVCVPDMESARRISARLGRIGNLASDGRPILGLDSRDLLEIVLEAGQGSFLFPAHAWTPWFAVLGSKSGFDSVEECYRDLSPHVFAIETGLSSDPPMNWRVSSLDRFRLVSSSDAHSPRNLGREACLFDTDLGFHSIRRALETGAGYSGTIEFFPEEGKYHLDGHRACGVRLEPAETRRMGGVCPACGGRVTVGVMHRVEDLADRPEPVPPPTAGKVTSLVPLAEILAECLGVGPLAKKVGRAYEDLLARVGPEIHVLTKAPIEDIEKAGYPLAAEAVARLRRGEVAREAGYDGAYGRIRLLPDAGIR